MKKKSLSDRAAIAEIAGTVASPGLLGFVVVSIQQNTAEFRLQLLSGRTERPGRLQ